MNALNLAQTAYSSLNAPARTERGTEYDAFVRVTVQLKNADQKGNYPNFIQVLHENRTLWTALAVDVAGDENKLPQQLRAQIFYLAEFTIVHTSRVIAGNADTDALIDVNTAIMRGLVQNGATQ